MKKRIIVIGGGAAGMQTALRLAEQGAEAVLLEKEAELGGKLRGWHVLFPSFTPAGEVLSELRRRVAASGVRVETGAEVVGLSPREVRLADGRTLACDAAVLCTGFTLFDASVKEEYGYGIYDNVLTSVDVERMLREGRVAKADGSQPRRIAFLHCVGSRDEKVCQQHCSKVCCITGVKQAMEMKRLFPDADVFNFYMDIRMFGPGYEEMYREAQQRYNIHFVRGRISEAGPTLDGWWACAPTTTTPRWPPGPGCGSLRAGSCSRATCSWTTSAVRRTGSSAPGRSPRPKASARR